MKKSLSLVLSVLLLCLGLNYSAKALVEAIAKSNRVYDPNWSVRENNGALGMHTLAPYQRIDDNDKLAKTPLVLVHGVISENRPYSNWGFLLDELEKPSNEKFFEGHPIYIYRYPSSSKSWKEISDNLAIGLSELLADYPPGTKMKVVVSSMGGNLLCSATQPGSTVEPHIERVLSLGTPYWGTPLLNKKLMLENIPDRDRSVNFLVTQVSSLLFPTLQAQLPWTLPLEASEAKVSNSCDHLKGRIINYGGFMASPITESAKVSDREVVDWLMDKLKHADYRHAWDASMHYKMGWEIEKSFRPIYLFRFNDGLVPIFSSLYLDPNLDIFEGQQSLTPAILQKIKTAKPKARLYAGIDHTDLTSRENGRKAEPIRDLLSGSDESIAASIVKDLK